MRGPDLGATQAGTPLQAAPSPASAQPQGAPSPSELGQGPPEGPQGGPGGGGGTPGGPPEGLGPTPGNGEGAGPARGRRGRPPRGDPEGNPGGGGSSDSSQFSDTPEGKDRRIAYLKKKIRSNTRGKVKEAEKVEVPQWPEPNKTQDWKATVRSNLLATSGRPVEAAVFYGEIRTMSFEELGDPGVFQSLDSSWAASLIRILTGDLRTAVTVLNVEYETNGKALAGRQIYKLCLEDLKTEEGEEELHDFEDLQGVKMHKNNLRRFLRDWDMCLLGLREKGEIGASVYRSLFLVSGSTPSRTADRVQRVPPRQERSSRLCTCSHVSIPPPVLQRLLEA